MTRYFDIDGNEQSAQDRYNESQIREHGGTYGNWTDEPEYEPEPDYTQQVPYQGAQPQQEPYLDDAGLEYGPEFDDGSYEPQLPDPLTSENYQQEMEQYLDWRDSQLGSEDELPDFSEQQQWSAAQEAEQNARALVAEQAAE